MPDDDTITMELFQTQLPPHVVGRIMDDVNHAVEGRLSPSFWREIVGLYTSAVDHMAEIRPERWVESPDDVPGESEHLAPNEAEIEIAFELFSSLGELIMFYSALCESLGLTKMVNHGLVAETDADGNVVASSE